MVRMVGREPQRARFKSLLSYKAYLEGSVKKDHVDLASYSLAATIMLYAVICTEWYDRIWGYVLMPKLASFVRSREQNQRQNYFLSMWNTFIQHCRSYGLQVTF